MSRFQIFTGPPDRDFKFPTMLLWTEDPATSAHGQSVPPSTVRGQCFHTDRSHKDIDKSFEIWGHDGALTDARLQEIKRELAERDGLLAEYEECLRLQALYEANKNRLHGEELMDLCRYRGVTEPE